MVLQNPLGIRMTDERILILSIEWGSATITSSALGILMLVFVRGIWRIQRFILDSGMMEKWSGKVFLRRKFEIQKKIQKTLKGNPLKLDISKDVEISPTCYEAVNVKPSIHNWCTVPGYPSACINPSKFKKKTQDFEGHESGKEHPPHVAWFFQIRLRLNTLPVGHRPSPSYSHL